MSPLMDGHGNGRPLDAVSHKQTEDLVTRRLAEDLINKFMPVMNKVARHQRYRYCARIEGIFERLLKLSITAPRAKTITKLAELVDTIDELHSWLKIGAEQKIIRAGIVGEVMQPTTPDHPGGSLWQLSKLAKSMLFNQKKKKG